MALLFVQQTLSVYLTFQLWPHIGRPVRYSLSIALLTGVLHAFVLIVQLPRALRWRPRRSVRPSTELQLERQRIARELHDRIGSQLVSALALFSPDQKASALQRAALEHGLLELRLLVDSMGGPDRSLVDQLAQLRYRVQPVFEHQGIAIEWDVSAAELPDAPRDPVLVLVAQEALSNIIQHAQATRVLVSLTRLPAPGTWQFDVCDNGRGLPQAIVGDAKQTGFGMGSMRERVRQAGGELELVASAGGGVCVRVKLVRHL